MISKNEKKRKRKRKKERIKEMNMLRFLTQR